MLDYKKIILVGGGGHCKSVIDVIENTDYSILGVLDMPDKIGSDVLGYPIIGSDEDISIYFDKALFLVTLGQINNPEPRKMLHCKITEAGGKFATIISPTAYVSKHAEIGEGTVVLHKAVVNAGVLIGKGCIINTCANIDHDSVVGDYSHISTGVMVNGNCRIGKEVFIGSQSTVANNISIVDNTVVSAGVFIAKNIVSSGTYVSESKIRKIR
ncbi:MAG: acetyltransferase [Bacteroidales bacterium]|nr:acetyltransferase [Bacteroidales bacterium]